MLRSTRAALAMGLGCVGVVGLIGGRSVAQGPADGKVQRVASNTATANGAAPASAVPALAVGTLDVEKVFKDYEKVKYLGEALEAKVKARYTELSGLATKGKAIQQEHERWPAGSPDAKKLEDQMTQLKAEIEAKRENSQREFSQEEAETMIAIYNEIADMAQAVAKSRGMTLVVKYNEGKLASSEPNSAMAAMSKTVIYSDPRFDITADTVKYLNARYKAVGSVAPRTSAPAAAANARPAGPAAAPNR